MKICIALALCCLLLTGCASEPTLETVTDEIVQPVMVTAYTPTFTLPKDAAVTTIESEENGTIYFCDGYTVTVCSLPPLKPSLPNKRIQRRCCQITS